MSIVKNEKVTTAAKIGLVDERTPAAFVAEIQRSIEQEKSVIVAEAKKHADDFLERSKLAQEGFRAFWVYVRRNKASLEIVWVRNVLRNKRSSTIFFNEPIPKGPKSSYPQKAFKGASDHEIIDILMAEEKFALLRQRWSILTGLARELRKYEKRASELEQLNLCVLEQAYTESAESGWHPSWEEVSRYMASSR
jgi:hypothetical protein